MFTPHHPPIPAFPPPHPRAVPALPFCRPWGPWVYFHCFYGFTCTRRFSAQNPYSMRLLSLNMRFSGFIRVVSRVTPSFPYSVIRRHQFRGGAGVFNFYFWAAQLVRSQFPDWGSNPCPCNESAESQPPDHQGVPGVCQVLIWFIDGYFTLGVYE